MSTSIAFDIIAKDRASASFDKVGRSAHKSSGALKKFAKVGVLAVAAGAAVAGKALFDMGKMAIADEQAQAVLAKTLKNAANATKGQVKATESWISAQGKALGVTDDELRPALGRLVAVTHDVGKAQKLASLGMNIAAGTGKSLQTVTTALAKAQTGSVAGLSKLGVKTKNLDGSTRSLKDITEDLAKTYKGSASTAANTTQGKFNRLKVQFDETKEAIGAKLIPVAGKLADWLLTKVLPAAQKLGGELRDKFGPTFSKIGGFITDKFAPALKDLAGKWLDGVRKMFDNVGKSMEDNKPFLDQLKDGFKLLGKFLVEKVMPALGTMYEKVFPALGTVIGTSITLVRKLQTAYLFLGEYGVKSLRLLLNAALETFGGILKAADTGLSWIPGIGDRIHAAKIAFDNFKDGTVANLKKTEDALKAVRDRINGIKPKTVKIDADTGGAIVKLTALQRKIDGLHGKTINIYAKLLKSGLPTGHTPTNADLGLPADYSQYNNNSGQSAHARGTGYFRGGGTWVGEEGPEYVELPRGSRIHDAARSKKMSGGGGSEIDYDRLGAAIVRALERGTQLVRLPDAGRGAYQAGAAF